MLLTFHVIEINRVIQLRLKDLVEIHDHRIDMEISIQKFDTIGKGIQRKDLNSFDDGCLF